MVAATIVSIGCAMCLNPFTTLSFNFAYENRIDGEMWHMERWKRTGVFMMSSLRWLGPEGGQSQSDPSPSDLAPYWFKRFALTEDEKPDDSRLLAAYGWPLLALRYECQIPGGEPNTDNCSCPVTGLDPWQDPIMSYTLHRVIPCYPIWRGLLANTLLYAIFAGVIFHWLPALRRHVRYRYGKCPKCAYNLKHDLKSGCPECGWGRDDTSIPAKIKET